MNSAATVDAPVSGPVAATPGTRRVVSVDALRGFDMFWILGADRSCMRSAKFHGTKC